MAELIDAATDAGKSGEAEAELNKDAVTEGAKENAEKGGVEAEAEGEEPKLSEKQQAAFDKRVGKEVGKRKSAEERAERAEVELKELRARADADDAEAVIAAAQEAGVMPELLGPGEAKGMADLSHARTNIRMLGDALEDQEGDEIVLGGKRYARADVKASLREWKDRISPLERRFGGAEQKAREKGLAIWKLGLAASRAGWKPGEKPKAVEEVEVDVEAEPKPKLKPKAEIPADGGEKARGGDAPAQVSSTRDLAGWLLKNGGKK